MILVVGGGRGDTLPLADALLDALDGFDSQNELTCRILAGPNMAIEDYKALVARPTKFPVRVSRRFEEATDWLQLASVAITRAGYNSLCEILTLHKKAVVIPREDPGSEQRMRSHLFAGLGLVEELDLAAAHTDLAQKLLRLLSSDDVPDMEKLPPLDGAQIVAQTLLG
jgi:predicted glycosyltransferase